MIRIPFRRTTLVILTLALFFTMVIPTYADSNVFKKGDSSPVIAEVQAALKKLGFFDEVCTGYFGTVTEAAVIKFQKK
jgi:peptidoglycan hydrolase-like protein with peptidoglycan-binding domain